MAAAPVPSQGRPTIGPRRAAVVSGTNRSDRGARVGRHTALLPPGRMRQARNPRRNRQRRRRRYQRWLRRRRRYTGRPRGGVGPQAPGRSAAVSEAATKPSPAETAADRTTQGADGTAAPDPPAHLRRQRGRIDRLPKAELWALLRQVRRADGGPRCPHCGEESPTCLWLVMEHFAAQQAAVENADRVGVSHP